VYRTGDPRAKHLQRLSERLTTQLGAAKWYQISARVHALVQKEKGLLPNVDFYSASTYQALGIPRDLFTPLFAVSRISGWTAHVLEQRAHNRLIRPRADYRGPAPRPYVPLEQR
jgi:citrate synthase